MSNTKRLRRNENVYQDGPEGGWVAEWYYRHPDERPETHRPNRLGVYGSRQAAVDALIAIRS